MRRVFALFLLGAAAAAASLGQTFATFTTMASFNGSNGSDPLASLVQGLDGNFYGSTYVGGSNNGGTVFKITPTGEPTSLYSFAVPYGSGPDDPLVQAPNGNFYGTTQGGGVGCYGFGCGTVFTITPEGGLTTLARFSDTNGRYPYGLVRATNGDYYGVTADGGLFSSSCRAGCGTLFMIDASGALTTLHAFDSADGASPSSTLIQAYDGHAYGITALGGAGNYGTVFQLATGGALTTLHSFTEADGEYPVYGLVEATDGNLYGTTVAGPGTACGGSGCGTVFRIAPAGDLTTLYFFDSTGGNLPNGTLVEGSDGNFYGTTVQGGASDACILGCGTVFRITPAGDLTTLFTFDLATGTSYGGLLQATDGSFYGTTASGGAWNDGTVFRLSAGLGPFVKTLPSAATVGATIHILGTNLTAPASVTFNGTPAAITSLSPSQIVTTVPSGATSGKVEVTLPSGTLSSNARFEVLP
jgi:uncharacterized repeat protein (TIGR03803 family)